MAHKSELPPAEDRQLHADRLSQARSGWLPAAIRESRRLERRARWRQLLLAQGLRAPAAAGPS
jgi:hypothetical protein